MIKNNLKNQIINLFVFLFFFTYTYTSIKELQESSKGT